MRESSKLVHELKSIIEFYLNEHPNMTLNGLSKRCGVASSTLGRIVHLETKEDPNPATVLGIVSAIFKESSIEDLLLQVEGEIKKSLQKSYSFLNRFKYRPELSDLLTNRDNYFIYKLAANRSGITELELVDLLGKTVKSRIKELLDLELIYESQGRLHAREKNFMLRESVSKKHIPELLRFTESEGRFEVDTLFMNVSESVNKQAYDEILRILRQARKEISEILSSDESNGEIPLFLTSILDTMDV